MNARCILEAAIRAARAAESSVVLIRPRTLAAIAHLIEWKRCSFHPIPTFRSADGSAWPLRISDDLYEVRAHG